MKKTNAARILDKNGIAYKLIEFPVTKEHQSGQEIARLLGEEPELVFKTILLKADDEFLVAVVPVTKEIDLKKAAKAFKKKKVGMLPLKELTKVTGYVRGGCSPVGMKKAYRTAIDATAEGADNIYVSAGERGKQFLLDPRALSAFLDAGFFELT